MFDSYSIQDLLGHTEHRVDLAYPRLPQQGQTGYSEQSVEWIRKISRPVSESSCLRVLEKARIFKIL